MADEPDSPPISFNRQIGGLDIGGTVAVARRVPREGANDISGIKGRMRNSVNPAVSKAKKRHGTDYQTDTGEFLTQDGHVVVAVAVTRIA